MSKYFDFMDGNSDKVRNVMSIISGVIVSYIVTGIMFAVFALLLTMSEFPETFISFAVVSTVILSIVVGSIFLTQKSEVTGWSVGTKNGMFYFIVMYLLKAIVFSDYGINLNTIWMIFICLLSGSIGGILGLNLKVWLAGRMEKA